MRGSRQRERESAPRVRVSSGRADRPRGGGICYLWKRDAPKCSRDTNSQTSEVEKVSGVKEKRR